MKRYLNLNRCRNIRQISIVLWVASHFLGMDLIAPDMGFANDAKIIDLTSLTVRKTSKIDPYGQCDKEERFVDPYLYATKPLDQKESKTCYAHVAAQLHYSFHCRKTQKPLFLSPTFLAMQYHFGGWRFFLPKVGKHSATTLSDEMDRASLAFWVLRQSVNGHQVPISYLGEPPYESWAEGQVMEGLYQFVLNYFSQPDLQQPNLENLLSYVVNSEAQIAAKIRSIAKEIYVFLNNRKNWILQPITGKVLHKRTLFAFFQHRFPERGQLQATLRLPGVYSQGGFVRFLREELAKDTMPWLISVHGDSFFSANASTRSMNIIADSRHSMVVYGYRCQAGRVEFLLRNSWGGASLRELETKLVPREQGKGLKGDFWIEAGLLAEDVAFGPLTLARLQ